MSGAAHAHAAVVGPRAGVRDLSSSATRTVRRARVLVVDTDPRTCWLVRRAVGGVAVVLGRPDAGEALEILNGSDTRMDVVVVDLVRAATRGSDLLQRLPWPARPRRVVALIDPDEGAEVEALGLGADR